MTAWHRRRAVYRASCRRCLIETGTRSTHIHYPTTTTTTTTTPTRPTRNSLTYYSLTRWLRDARWRVSTPFYLTDKSVLLYRVTTWRCPQRRSQKFSTGGASICSIPFCPFPFSYPTKSALQAKNVMTYHTDWMIERTTINSYTTKSNTK